MDKYVGKRLDGRYEIEEIIGIGGMAVVYKAHDNIENRTVAIKILKDEFISNDEFIRRFKNESKAIAMLSHPNIVSVYDVSFGDLIQYIVMEYIDGITLKEFIEHKGTLRWKDAVYFTIQILKALQHAHDKGIVHRDVKPQNIMVLQDGSIKVTDFGIARFSRSEQRTISDKAIGSVHYISPEQAKGEKTDEKADIYSVGVMLYEMLTGRLPFDAERAVSVAIMQLQSNPKLPTELNPSIPLGLEQITMHAMQKLTERRYQSAAEMLCDLERFKKDPEATFGYTYFVDNSPTKFVNSSIVHHNTIEDIPSNSRTNIENGKDNDARERKSSSTIPILAGIATALVAVLVILGAIFLPRLFSSTGSEIKCPDFEGKTPEWVENSQYYTDFNIDFQNKTTSDQSKIGKIIDQSQPADKMLKKNSSIILYVGAKEGLVSVPNVYDMSELEAKKELKIKGFGSKVEYEPSEDIEKDNVIRTSPMAGKAVTKGTEVTLYISTGKEEKLVEVPDITHIDESKAVERLKEKGLKYNKTVRTLTAADGEILEKGLVLSQSVKAGQMVNGDTTVNFEVSDGTIKSDLVIEYEADEELEEETKIRLSVSINGKTYKSSEFNSLKSRTVTIKNVVLTNDETDTTVYIDDGSTTEEYCDIRITPFKKQVVTQSYDWDNY